VIHDDVRNAAPEPLTDDEVIAMVVAIHAEHEDTLEEELLAITDPDECDRGCDLEDLW